MVRIMDVPRNMGSKMENVTLLKADMVAGSRCPCWTHPAPIREATPSSPMDLAAAEKAPLVEAEARPLMPFASEDVMAVKCVCHGSAMGCRLDRLAPRSVRNGRL